MKFALLLISLLICSSEKIYEKNDSKNEINLSIFDLTAWEMWKIGFHETKEERIEEKKLLSTFLERAKNCNEKIICGEKCFRLELLKDSLQRSKNALSIVQFSTTVEQIKKIQYNHKTWTAVYESLSYIINIKTKEELKQATVKQNFGIVTGFIENKTKNQLTGKLVFRLQKTDNYKYFIVNLNSGKNKFTALLEQGKYTVVCYTTGPTFGHTSASQFTNSMASNDHEPVVIGVFNRMITPGIFVNDEMVICRPDPTVSTIIN